MLLSFIGLLIFSVSNTNILFSIVYVGGIFGTLLVDILVFPSPTG